jgi:hypothetical protein
MLKRLFISALLVAAVAAFCEGPDAAPDSVRIASEQKAAGAELIEWVYTLDCRAGGTVPSLRVTLGNQSSTSNAGVPMVVSADDRATGTVTVRVELKDKATPSCTVTVDVAAGSGAMAGQTVRLPTGKDLATVTDLKALPGEAHLRRAIGVGSVAGCTISLYVMPGRTLARPTPDAPPPPGDPAAQATEVLHSWVRAVKTGDLEAFSTIVQPEEWHRLDPAQRSRRLQEYQEAFKTVLGEDYSPDQFKVDYTGIAGAGRLRIHYGDKQLPDLNIRFLGGRWVLVEL